MDGGGERIWPANWPVIRAWSFICTQWRTVAVSGGLGPGRLVFLGLDYAGCRAGLAGAGIDPTPDLWADLLAMEAAAIEALNTR